MMLVSNLKFDPKLITLDRNDMYCTLHGQNLVQVMILQVVNKMHASAWMYYKCTMNSIFPLG